MQGSPVMEMTVGVRGNPNPVTEAPRQINFQMPGMLLSAMWSSLNLPFLYCKMRIHIHCWEKTSQEIQFCLTGMTVTTPARQVVNMGTQAQYS